MGDAIYQVTIEGIRPLVHHNGRLADPLDEHTMAIKASAHKKQKSEEDHEELGRLELELLETAASRTTDPKEREKLDDEADRQRLRMAFARRRKFED